MDLFINQSESAARSANTYKPLAWTLICLDEFLKRCCEVVLFFFSSALKDHLETGSSDLPGSQEDPPALIFLCLSVWGGSV